MGRLSRLAGFHFEGGLNYRRGPTHAGVEGSTLQRDNGVPRAHARNDLARGFGARTPAALVTALVFVTLTMGLVLVVASLSWWDVYVGAPWNQTYKYYLGAVCAEGSCGDYTDSATLRSFFPQTYGLVLTALALSVFELAFLILAIFERKFAVGILVSGLLGSITLMVAPIYFYFTLPVVLSSDGAFFTSFFGSYTDRGTTYTWGGGPGWFMAPFVVIVFLVATMVAFFAASDSAGETRRSRPSRPLASVSRSLRD